MKQCQLTHDKIACPIPMSEDRLMECLHNMERLESEYHDPKVFRFSLNALLASLGSVSAIVQKEIEQKGDVDKWNVAREPFKKDPWLGAAKGARNVTLHQKAIFDGSKVYMGLYRWRRLKLTFIKDIPGDIHSSEILKWWCDSEAGRMFLDSEHSALGEEYGVLREYWIKEISTKEDTLTAMRRALIRAHDLVAVAHGIYSVQLEHISDDWLSTAALNEVRVLLESDVDPTLPKKWGW